MLTSQSAHSLTRYKSQVQAEIEAHLDPASGVDKSWRRNASLAEVKLLFDSSTAFSRLQLSSEEGNGTSKRVAAIVKYLRGYGKASTAYNDLRPFVEHLSPTERKQLLESLKNNNVFSDVQKLGDGKYPAKQDVNPLSCLVLYSLWLTGQSPTFSSLPNSYTLHTDNVVKALYGGADNSSH